MTPCPTALSSSLHKNFTQIERRAMLSFRSLSSLMTNIPYAALLTILVPLAGIAQNPKLITNKSITFPPLGTQHIDRIDYPNHVASTNGLFDGLAFAANSTLCAAQGCGTPDFPLAIATLSNGSRAYVASEGDGAVCDLNPTNPTLTGNIPTSANPDGLLLNKIQSLLYVSNGGSDTVFVVDTATDTVLQTFSVRSAGPLNQAGTPTPLGLSLSENGDPVCCLG